MKNLIIIHSFIFCFFTQILYAQNVSILPTGITPSSSYPKITYEQILALPTPNAGDLAYDLTFNCLRLFNGTKWLQIITQQDTEQPSAFGWQLESDYMLGVNGITRDASGNIYATGNFKGVARFGNTNYTSVGDNDVFVAKYTSNGTFLWVNVGGSPAGDIATDVCLDPNGNVIITGYYFDAITFGNQALSITGGCDIFVAKYDGSGGLLWVKNAGGTGLDICHTVDADASGNLYLGGYFSNTCTFYGTGTITLNSSGGEDGFLSKLNQSGNVIWATSIQGSETQRVKDLVINGSEIVALGTFSNTTSFGNSISLSSNSNNIDIFLGSFSTSGLCNNAIGFGSASTDEAAKITKDSDSNIWACGSLFGNAVVGGFDLVTKGNYDVFYIKLLNNLLISRAGMFGGISMDMAGGIGSDANGNVFISGNFNESITLNNQTISSKGSTDIFMAKISGNGEIQYLVSYGSKDYENSNCLTIGQNYFLGGTFSKSIKFGNTLTGANQNINGYILRLAE